MHDLDFFSVYKRQSSKNQSVKIFLIILLVVVLLFNFLIIGGGRMLYGNIQVQIDQKNAYINNDDTKMAILLAEITKNKLTLTNEYLALIQKANDSIDQVNILDSGLIMDIQKLVPVTTVVNVMSVTDNTISIECSSAVVTDPMDLYHALMNDKRFANIVFSSIVMDPIAGSAVYSLSFQVAGGEQP